MRRTTSWFFRHRRAVAGSVAIGGFLTLFFAAKTFSGDLDFAGLSDDTIRTIGHFTGYGFLATCLAIAFRFPFRFRIALVWLIASSIATAEEFHQLVVPGRYFGIDDIATNLIGVSAFLLIYKLAQPILRQRMQKQLLP